MNQNLQILIGPFGRFIRKENGLIYYYKPHGITMDKSMVVTCLDKIRELDDSGNARLIVIQGFSVEYTFDAQYTILTTDLLAGLAYVTQNNAQYLIANLIQDIGKTLKAKFPIGIFANIRDAETLLLQTSVKTLATNHQAMVNPL